MDHYLDIQINPPRGQHSSRGLSRIYTQLHLQLVQSASTHLGVSFPRANRDLGNLLRLHGEKKHLQVLLMSDWCKQTSEIVKILPIRPIPETVHHRTISRVRSNMSRSKLRRLQTRGSISKEEVLKYKAKMCAESLDQPYVELLSGSNGHRYRRYLQFGPVQEKPSAGGFDVFGLSETATVPWF